ncbi:MAG TPA: hypothetical protein VKZ53_09870 [Candidatus Angelobacter sp.]|nr:hypothetical protein [Candidatus Angelobacter sp.]
MCKLFLVAGILVFSTMAMAQQKGSGDSSADVFVGYSVLNGNTLSTASGLEASLNGHVTNWLGLKADLSGNWGSGGHVYNVLFGPQVTHHIDKLDLFGHGLLGVSRFHIPGASSTGVGWELGGGADWNLGHRFAIRVAQLDYHGSHLFGATQRDFRYSTGIVFHLK